MLDLSLTPVLDATGRVVGMTLFGRDVSDRKEAEARLGEMHRNLLDVSRRAGMAEIATGVLHNVGNALNSVNVSVNLLAERLHQSRVPGGLLRTTGLLREHEDNLCAFFAQDARAAAARLSWGARWSARRGTRGVPRRGAHPAKERGAHQVGGEHATGARPLRGRGGAPGRDGVAG
ncbi:hypothetical protein ACN28S_57680 [Cystobacter fuscus]